MPLYVRAHLRRPGAFVGVWIGTHPPMAPVVVVQLRVSRLE